MKILVAEDQKLIAQSIRKGLEQEGYAVDVAYDGEDAYNSAVADAYDLIVLDVMMPIMDGFEVCKKLRNDSVKTPILFLTARDSDADIVRGLTTGGDDYLAKPFSFDVLVARIQSLLRRPHDTYSDILEVGELRLDPSRKRVEREGRLIDLTLKEYAILEYLMRNAGSIVSKQTLMSHAWNFDADILPNTVEVFINFLRKKVDKPFSTSLIHTVRGFGYRIGTE